MSNIIQNFYKATLSQDWSIGTGKFYVSTKPSVSPGRLTISPSSDALREIIEYTSTGTDSNGDYIMVSTRGVGGTTEQSHTLGEKIRMNITAEDWTDMQTDINNIVASGVPNASTTTMGGVEIATDAEVIAGTDTGGTGAKLVATPSQFTKKLDSVRAFAGTGADGILNITSGTTTIDLGGVSVFTKNYSSISITGTGSLAFSNPHNNGTIIILKSQGDVTITSSTNPSIDLRLMGGNYGTGTASTFGNDGNGGFGLIVGTNPGKSNLNSTNGGSGVYFNSSYVYGNIPVVFCGAGGMGGSGGAGNAGGRGGRGGGGLLIECGGNLNISSVINTSGENGVAGTNGGGSSTTIYGGAGGGSQKHGTSGTSASTTNGGGGGGAGGGSILIQVSGTITNTGTFTVTGGSGGSGGATGGNGGDGYYLVISKNNTF